MRDKTRSRPEAWLAIGPHSNLIASCHPCFFVDRVVMLMMMMTTTTKMTMLMLLLSLLLTDNMNEDDEDVNNARLRMLIFLLVLSHSYDVLRASTLLTDFIFCCRWIESMIVLQDSRWIMTETGEGRYSTVEDGTEGASNET